MNADKRRLRLETLPISVYLRSSAANNVLQLFTGLSLRRFKHPDRLFWTFLAG
jgi:hypothetical protein